MRIQEWLDQNLSRKTQASLVRNAIACVEKHSEGNADFSLQPSNQNRGNSWIPNWQISKEAPLLLINPYDKKFKLQVTPNPELHDVMHQLNLSDFRLNLKLFQGKKDNQFRFEQIPEESCRIVLTEKHRDRNIPEIGYQFTWSEDGRKLDCIFACRPEFWTGKFDNNMTLFVIIAEIKLGNWVVCADGVLVKKMAYGGSLEDDVERCKSGDISMISTKRRAEIRVAVNSPVPFKCHCGDDCANQRDCDLLQFMRQRYADSQQKKQDEETFIIDDQIQVDTFTELEHTQRNEFVPQDVHIPRPPPHIHSPIDVFTEVQTQSNFFFNVQVPCPPPQRFDRAKKRNRVGDDYRCEMVDVFQKKQKVEVIVTKDNNLCNENEKPKFDVEDDFFMEPLEYGHEQNVEKYSDVEDLFYGEDEDEGFPGIKITDFEYFDNDRYD